jgi:hypothetical protein
MFGRQIRAMKKKHEIKMSAEMKFRRGIAGYKVRT